MVSRTRSERALQVWQILISAAANRQTLTISNGCRGFGV